VVSPEDVDTALEILKANGEDAYLIGEIVTADELNGQQIEIV